MTSPGMNIEPAAVRQHAGSVDQVAEMIDEAVAAAGHVRASNESYGQLVGGLFTPPLNHFADTYLEQTRGIASAAQRQADALRATAGQAEAADGSAADRLGGN